MNKFTVKIQEGNYPIPPWSYPFSHDNHHMQCCHAINHLCNGNYNLFNVSNDKYLLSALCN